MKRYSRDLIKNLTALGFDHVWTNTQGYPCYAHPDDPEQQELSVSPSIANEQAYKTLLRRAQRIAGTVPAVEKRKGGQVKERAEADRERARQRLHWIQQKQQHLIDSNADAAMIAKARELIDLRERELAHLQRLMTQPAQGGNAHRGTGQARHVTGNPR